MSDDIRGRRRWVLLVVGLFALLLLGSTARADDQAQNQQGQTDQGQNNQAQNQQGPSDQGQNDQGQNEQNQDGCEEEDSNCVSPTTTTSTTTTVASSTSTTTLGSDDQDQDSCNEDDNGCPSTTTSTSTTTTTVAPTTTSTTTSSTTTSSNTTSTSTSSTTTTVPTTLTTTSSTTTTTASPTTSATTTTQVPTTTTSLPGGQTTTTVRATTSTTTTLAHEICGNCIDDDGNGLTDFEDPACCSQTEYLSLSNKTIRVVSGRVLSRLKMTSSLAGTSVTTVNPLGQDVYLQIRKPNGELLCAKFPAEHFMKRGRRRYKFWDSKGEVTTTQGVQDVSVRFSRRGKIIANVFDRKVRFTGATSPLGITLAFHDGRHPEQRAICASTMQDLKAGRRGALHVP